MLQSIVAITPAWLPWSLIHGQEVHAQGQPLVHLSTGREQLLADALYEILAWKAEIDIGPCQSRQSEDKLKELRETRLP